MIGKTVTIDSEDLETLLLRVWSLCDRTVAIALAAASAQAHPTQYRQESERCDEAYPALTIENVVLTFTMNGVVLRAPWSIFTHTLCFQALSTIETG